MGVLKLHGSQRRRGEEGVRPPENARHLKRAQALLWGDAGESVSQVAKRLRVTRQSIYNRIARIQHRTGCIASRVLDTPRSGRPPDKSKIVDQVIPDLLGTDPQQHGYRATGGTNALLRDVLHRQHHLKGLTRPSEKRSNGLDTGGNAPAMCCLVVRRRGDRLKGGSSEA